MDAGGIFLRGGFLVKGSPATDLTLEVKQGVTLYIPPVVNKVLRRQCDGVEWNSVERTSCRTTCVLGAEI